MYTTYDFYTNEYGGILIDAPAFDVMEAKASAKLNYLTYGNITDADLQTYSWEVQMAVCTIMDELVKIDKAFTNMDDASAGNIKSMSSGGQSVTYAENIYTGALASIDAQNQLLKDKVMEYLFDTGLFYAGVEVW